MTEQRRIPRALVVLLCAAGAVVTLAGIREAGSIIGPVLLALVLVLAVSPVRTWLERRGAPGWTLVAAPLTLVLLLLLSLIAVLALSAAQLTTLASTYGQQFDQFVVQVQQFAERLGIGGKEVNQAIRTLDPGKVFGLVSGFASGLLGVFSSLVIIVIVVLAMCLDARAVTRILSSDMARERSELVGALGDFAHNTRRYLIVSTVFGLICSVLDAIALWVLGVPLPILWGVLALFTNYVPNIGFVIGLIPPALLGLLQGGPKTMILVIVCYIAINFVIQSLIQPKFLGDAVGLSTTVTMMSLLLWAFVLGPLGALLAIPLSLLVRALLVDSDPRGQWAAAFISGRAPQDAVAKAPPDGPGPSNKPAKPS
ncbi:AI-2E family transporter [Streptosporangium saharense]|uniref:Putative PurR-regulated permease PerM n=1 Tax=Streptosporangium saharense TaxID=1706840 RepID=A0A7W7VM14_9ACTN|nr:AI-2E family transporter [Streptosporangium saharense]MBB4914760.1 putative PurR-regulated permease PerM [Streptosporangium saharense]